jgi:hypothetical protein
LLDRNSKDTILVTEHKVKLEGLQSNTKYYYTIGSFKDTLQAGPDNYFIILPTPVPGPPLSLEQQQGNRTQHRGKALHHKNLYCKRFQQLSSGQFRGPGEQINK